MVALARGVDLARGQRRLAQACIGAPHSRMQDHLGQRGERADAQTAVGRPIEPLQVVDLADVDDLRRPGAVDLQRRGEFGSAGGHARTSGREVRDGLVQRTGHDDGDVRGQ